MEGLGQDPLFVGLTRPQMFAGVPYGYFIVNGVIAAEFFLIFRSAWAIGVALLVHGIGMILCLREPPFFDLWVTRLSQCPRVRNYALWQCNSYRP